MATFTIEPRGAFSLRESVQFGFGQRDAEEYTGVMRLAFCLDGYATQAAAEVRQDHGGDVHLAVFAPAGTDLAAVWSRTARVLSDSLQFVCAERRLPYPAPGVGDKDPPLDQGGRALVSELTRLVRWRS